MATALRLTAEACPSILRPTRELVEGVAIEHGLSERRAHDLKLCIHEAVANVARHAYDGRPGPVEVTVQDLGDALAVVVSDHGTGAPSKISNGGALGLWVMSHLSTGCTVRARSDGMEVEMLFPVSSPTPPIYPDTRSLRISPG
jgi:anti-sigma regulatory factor (Ser/Thr protein kinase)